MPGGNVRAAALLALFWTASGASAGAELQIEYPAIAKVLAQQVFTQDGRKYVRGDKKQRCNFRLSRASGDQRDRRTPRHPGAFHRPIGAEYFRTVRANQMCEESYLAESWTYPLMQSLRKTLRSIDIHSQIKGGLDKFKFHEPKAVAMICSDEIGAGIKRDGI